MMVFEDEIALRPAGESAPRPEPEVRECAEQWRFEAACARELRGDPD